jgi:hypothetical protein
LARSLRVPVLVMSTWKQFNEIGGAIIARGVCALITMGILYSFAGAAIGNPGKFFALDNITTWLSVIGALGLFGGYAILGNGPRRKK